jgi:hypothetical protein
LPPASPFGQSEAGRESVITVTSGPCRAWYMEKVAPSGGAAGIYHDALVFAGPMSAYDDESDVRSNSGIESELYCAFAGFILGVFIILLGAWMFYLGISGKETWVAKAFGHSNEFVDSLPGAVLFIAGMLTIRGTRRKSVALSAD